MEQSLSCEASSSLAGLIPHTLWNPEFHCCIHMSISISWSQFHPVHAPPILFLKIYFNIIFPSYKWSLPITFFHQNPVCTCPLLHICHLPHPSHSSWFEHPNYVGWGVQIMKLVIVWDKWTERVKLSLSLIAIKANRRSIGKSAIILKLGARGK